jgi:hypothetical protein
MVSISLVFSLAFSDFWVSLLFFFLTLISVSLRFISLLFAALFLVSFVVFLSLFSWLENYVITGVRKNAIHKTEYRLSCLGKPDIWCKLKRGEKKSGYPFRPNRKVLFLEENEK